MYTGLHPVKVSQELLELFIPARFGQAVGQLNQLADIVQLVLCIQKQRLISDTDQWNWRATCGWKLLLDKETYTQCLLQQMFCFEMLCPIKVV